MEKERERNVKVRNDDCLPFLGAPIADPNHNLGMWPDLESNRRFGFLNDVQPSHMGQGAIIHF